MEGDVVGDTTGDMLSEEGTLCQGRVNSEGTAAHG